jgi:hypothetical protein
MSDTSNLNNYTIKQIKKSFLEIYGNIKRDGADRLLDWLESTDFFTAPASTKYHLACEGGLCAHSVNVWQRLCKLVENEYEQTGNTLSFCSPETIAICGLLHDVCKANFYKTEMRNTKDENGRWIQVPYYTVDDQLPYGHGEKSVYIISGFMKLTREEAMAIRWHMGGFDDSVKGGGYAMNGAWEKYPLGVLLHTADLMATYIDEPAVKTIQP